MLPGCGGGIGKILESDVHPSVLGSIPARCSVGVMPFQEPLGESTPFLRQLVVVVVVYLEESLVNARTDGGLDEKLVCFQRPVGVHGQPRTLLDAKLVVVGFRVELDAVNSPFWMLVDVLETKIGAFWSNRILLGCNDDGGIAGFDFAFVLVLVVVTAVAATAAAVVLVVPQFFRVSETLRGLLLNGRQILPVFMA